MNYGKINTYDISNGTGVRVSLFVSGCRRKCKGCFNSAAWDFNYGQPFTEETEQMILEALKPDYIQGFTVLGGEPFEPENEPVVTELLKKIRETYPEKDIWCYTGYTYERDLRGKEMMKYIDVLVDGEFIEEQKGITLKFRGSRNQRILYFERRPMCNLGKLITEKEHCYCMDCADCPAYRCDEDEKHSYCDLVSYANELLKEGAKQTQEAFEMVAKSREYLAKKGENHEQN